MNIFCIKYTYFIKFATFCKCKNGISAKGKQRQRKDRNEKENYSIEGRKKK